MTSATGRSHEHAALLHGSAEHLVAAVVPFLAEGLAAGQVAVLACREDHEALLAEALGHDDRIVVLDREEIYTRSAHAIATYRGLVHRQVAAGAPRVRLVSEIPLDRRPQEWPEWHRYEAILNVAMEPLPLSTVCAYDLRQLPDAIVDEVEETHPALLTPGGRRPNDRYVDPATVLRRTPAVAVERAEDTPPTLDLADLADAGLLPELRARVQAVLDGPWGHGQQLRRRFAAAVAEVVGNAFRHGRPPVAVRLWAMPTRLECTVTDGGDGFDDPLAGYVPPGYGPARTGAGLWLVRQACDSLEVFRTAAGFGVRLITVLPGSDAPAAPGARTAADEAATERAALARAEARELVRRLSEAEEH